MRHTAVAGHLKPEEIKERMLSSESRQQFQRWQVIYITVTKRLKAEEVGELVGVCAGTVHQWVHQYNHKGPDVLILQGRGGRRRELLSWNEEEELREELRERGERGAIVIAKTIREYAAKKLGTEVSKDYAYDLLHRHGWRKIEPRPRHPKSDSETQEEFKKNFQRLWQPPFEPLRRKTHAR